MMNRITANDGITKSKQLKCMFDVQFYAYNMFENILLKVQRMPFYQKNI
jgi:hypothetical protein